MWKLKVNWNQPNSHLKGHNDSYSELNCTCAADCKTRDYKHHQYMSVVNVIYNKDLSNQMKCQPDDDVILLLNTWWRLGCCLVVSITWLTCCCVTSCKQYFSYEHVSLRCKNRLICHRYNVFQFKDMSSSCTQMLSSVLWFFFLFY